MVPSKDWKSIDRLPFLLALMLLVVLPVLFYVFCGPYLVANSKVGAIIVAAILQCSTFVFLLLTRFADPGSIPKAQPPPDIDDDFKYPLQQDVAVDGVLLKVKWCRTCNFYRPPRASHCSQCNNCVEEFDHHCPWLDNCIGAGNYRFFFMLLVNTTILIVIVVAFSLVVAIRGPTDNKKEHIGSIIVASVTGIVFLLVGSLLAFHVYLILLGQTTNEFVGGRFSYARNPFNKGWRHNCLRISCTTYRPMHNTPLPANVVDPRVQSSSSVTALFDSATSETSERGAPLNLASTSSDRSSQPSLLFNGSIDYTMPDTPTMAGTPPIASLSNDCVDALHNLSLAPNVLSKTEVEI